MLDGPSAVRALKAGGVTHVVWIPDSALGTWEPALRADPDLRLVRVCREGEAIGVAAGLLLGGKRPAVLIQCTGLFEAGDALRNVVHDLKLPLVLVVGVRGHEALRRGTGRDNCPVFTEPFLQAWQLPYVWVAGADPAAELAAACQKAWADGRAGAALLPE